MPASRPPLVALLTLAIAALSGCGVWDNSWESPPEELCQPTGRAFVGTGVYVAPEACTDVTLYALDPDPATNDSWVLRVGWPMYGEYHALELENLTTGDIEREILYLGDPEFTLYAGFYDLAGFEMAEGDNTIRYVEYTTVEDPPGEFTRTIYREGVMSLHVTLFDGTGS